MSLLKVENLSLKSYSGAVLVKNLSFEIHKGETLVILGESGSGKTLTSLAILDLLPNSVIKTSGTILVNEVEFNASMRGSQISMIMQAPATCFDQVYSIRTLFADTLKSHKKKQNSASSAFRKNKQVCASLQSGQNNNISSASFNNTSLPNIEISNTANVPDIEISNAASLPDIEISNANVPDIEISDAYFIKMIEAVELPNPVEILNSFAFQLSGGTLQRLMIALNLALNPSIIIADEATSDIDTVVQNEILKLLSTMNKREKGLLFITHDVRVARKMADRIIVMQNGEKIDEFSVQDLHKENRHAYTKKLLLAHTNLNTNPWGLNFSA